MGCSNSKPRDEKPEDPTDNDPRMNININIASLEEVKPVQVDRTNTSSVASDKPRDSHRLTSSGYMSDLASDRPAFTHAFVHNHASKRAAAILESKYETNEGTILGRGACGSVVAVRHKTTGELFAMKVVAVDGMGGTMEELMREIDIQRTLDHPNICKIFESYEDTVHKEVYIIMEICTGGSLVSRMKTHKHGYGERAAATIVEKILSSIIYCHHHGVVHRDIKLDNFIYEHEGEDAELKIIDFGFACEIGSGREAMWDQLGTPSYMAPELWSNEDQEYDSSVDMWAIGVVTYMLLSGKRPFHHENKKEKARMIRHDPLRFPHAEWDFISEDAKDFIEQLMQKRPRDRLSATAARNHPWIQNASRLHKGDDVAVEMARHQEIVDSLQSFSEANDLKKLALEVIAFSTPPAKLEELRNVFVKMDADDSGTISWSEFQHAMSLHPELNMDNVKRMYDNMDVDGSGEVDYTEFLSATLSAQKHSNASILNAFTTLDTDGDGFISQADITASLDGQMSNEAIAKMLEQADASGKVSFQVFKRTVLTGLKTSNETPTGMLDAIVDLDGRRRSVSNPPALPIKKGGLQVA